jgi:hypothetical protein
MEVFLEAADVARELGNLSIAAVRFAVLSGRLRPSARTRRGTRLFTLSDVAAFRKGREAALPRAVGLRRVDGAEVFPGRHSPSPTSLPLPLLDHEPAWPLEALLVEEVRAITVAMGMDNQQAILEAVTRTPTGACMDTVRDAPDRWLRQSIGRCAQFRLENHLPAQQLSREFASRRDTSPRKADDEAEGSGS